MIFSIPAHTFQWLAGICLCMATLVDTSEAIPLPQSNWQDVVRKTGYASSKGFFDNLVNIRRWVLTGTAYCQQRNRHILFDRRGTFIGYFSDPTIASTTQAFLNAQRAQLAQEQRVDFWAAGSDTQAGYPFALSCDQPDADLHQAFERYVGKQKSARLWGTWDGMKIGTPESTLSLHHALQQVYEDRLARQRISIPRELLSTLAGKILIESGGRAKAHSGANAKGIMQLSPSALKDCGLPAKFHFHRMAQIDCAFKLLEQNHRLLEPTFQSVFGHLPKLKQEELYAYLLLQAYHGGVGRVSSLLTAPETNEAALYFAAHQNNFSAGDIALGMVFHNLGRNRLGFSSLYYTVDVSLAREFACQRLDDLPGCP